MQLEKTVPFSEEQDKLYEKYQERANMIFDYYEDSNNVTIGRVSGMFEKVLMGLIVGSCSILFIFSIVNMFL